MSGKIFIDDIFKDILLGEQVLSDEKADAFYIFSYSSPSYVYFQEDKFIEPFLWSFKSGLLVLSFRDRDLYYKMSESENEHLVLREFKLNNGKLKKVKNVEWIHTDLTENDVVASISYAEKEPLVEALKSNKFLGVAALSSFLVIALLYLLLF